MGSNYPRDELFRHTLGRPQERLLSHRNAQTAPQFREEFPRHRTSRTEFDRPCNPGLCVCGGVNVYLQVTAKLGNNGEELVFRRTQSVETNDHRLGRVRRGAKQER